MRVKLNGIVMSSEWARIYRYFGYDACCARDVTDAVEAFAEAPDDEGLIFEVNSPGGSFFCGLEMWTALMDARRVRCLAVTAEIQSIAASAASVFCAGCDTVRISPVAQIMVHLPSTATEGDEVEHGRSVQMLQAGLESILNAYEAKCGGKTSRSELEAMTRSQTFITAQRALALGLADEIIDYSSDDEADPMSMVASVGAGIRCLAGMGTLPEYETLRARYDAEQAANAQTSGEGEDNGGDEPMLFSAGAAADIPPAGEPAMKDDWRYGARIAIAKLKN